MSSSLTEVNVKFGASVTDLQAGSTAAAEAIKSSTSQISEASTSMAAATTASTSEVVDGVRHMSEESEGYFASLREQIISAGESFETLNKSMSFMSTAAGAMSEFFMAGLGIEKVADMISEVAENGEQLLKLSEETGMTTEALSGLQVAARESGTSFDVVTRSLTRLPGIMQTAVLTPTSKAALAFQALGISAQDLKMDSVQQVLDAVSSSLSTYADGAQKTALVTDIFGQRAAQLVPLLNNLAGDGGIAGATAKAQAYGVAVSQDAAEADEKFMKSSADVGEQLKGMQTTISGAVIPALDVMLSNLNNTSGGMSVMQATAIVLGDAFKIIIEVLAAAGAGFSEVMETLVGLGGELGAVIIGAKALAEAFSGDFSQAYQDVRTAGTLMTQSWNNAINSMAQTQKNFMDTHNALWGSMDTTTPAITPQALPTAPTVADDKEDKAAEAAAQKTANTQTTIAADSAQTQEGIAKSVTQTQIDQWNAEVAAGTMTKEQETELEIQAANTQYQTQMQALNQKLALYKEGTVAYQQVLDQETQLTASHTQQVAKLNADMQTEIADQNAKAVKAATTEWQSGLAPIDQAFSQTVNGMIQGTETLQEGINKAVVSIVEKFAEMGEKMLMDWVAKEMAKLTATQITQAGVNASAQTGQAEQAAMNQKSILQNAYTAASGAYAATAGIPYVGPVLAPIAAAAAFAGTMAFDVISAEGGAGTIPADGTMAVLHENEMVLPASIANPLRSNLASSSTSSTSNNGSMAITYSPQINMPSGSSTSDLNSTLAQSSQQMYNYLQQNYFRNGALTLPGR